MKKILVISVLLAVSFLFRPCLSQAADEWDYDSTAAGIAKVKAAATLTYTNPATGKTITKKYKPTGSIFKIERDYIGALNPSDHKISISLADIASSMQLNASASGSGVKAGSKTDLTFAMDGGMEEALDQDYPAFDFTATDASTSTLLSMSSASMASITSEGSYTEVPSKTDPAVITINANIKYIIMGAVTVGSYSYPAKILVQVSGSKIQPKP